MVEVTDEMKSAFRAAQERRADELVAEGAPLGGHDILDRGLAAVLAIVERSLREQLADALEDHAIELRGAPFRRGDVGIEFICGIEDAAEMVRNGRVPDGDA